MKIFLTLTILLSSLGSYAQEGIYLKKHTVTIKKSKPIDLCTGTDHDGGVDCVSSREERRIFEAEKQKMEIACPLYAANYYQDKKSLLNKINAEELVPTAKDKSIRWIYSNHVRIVKFSCNVDLVIPAEFPGSYILSQTREVKTFKNKRSAYSFCSNEKTKESDTNKYLDVYDRVVTTGRVFKKRYACWLDTYLAFNQL